MFLVKSSLRLLHNNTSNSSIDNAQEVQLNQGLMDLVDNSGKGKLGGSHST